jgi:hypothetical protein
VDADHDGLGVARHGLVDGVVDDFVDEVVEAAGAGVADEHARALADGLQAFEDLDVLRVVPPVRFRGFGHVRLMYVSALSSGHRSNNRIPSRHHPEHDG